MTFLDTGFLIALVNPRDELHDRARLWSKRVRPPLVVTEYVVWEAINYFSLPPDRHRAQTLVTLLRGRRCEWIPASERLFEAGLRLHRDRRDKAWSLTDCISFIIMGEKSITQALAYDVHFEQAGFEALLRRDPE